MLNIKYLRDVIEAIKYKERLQQKDIADKLGYKNPYLSDVINGRKPISEQFSDKLASIFNIRVEYLQSGIGNVFSDGEGNTLKSAAIDTQQHILDWLKDKDDVIKSKDVEIKELREQINYYRSELERLKIAIVNSDDATLKKEIAV